VNECGAEHTSNLTEKEPGLQSALFNHSWSLLAAVTTFALAGQSHRSVYRFGFKNSAIFRFSSSGDTLHKFSLMKK
jgi:hypothetical protein